MKPAERIAELEKQLALEMEKNAGLVKALQEAKALGTGRGKSKSRLQAEQALAMLEQGPVALAQFAQLNPKYPNDVAYYIRTILKVNVHTVRTKGGSLYMLDKHFATYQEGQAKEKAAADAAKKEVTKDEAPVPEPKQEAAAIAA